MAAVTMTAVAREAGVSVSTVSHVVNGTRPVHPDTRRVVLDVMERLGFQHKPVAGSLAAGSTLTIGLAMPAAHHPAMRELADGIEEEASRRGLQMVLVDTHGNAETEERVVAHLLAHHIDGLLLAPSAGWQQRSLRLLRERAVPFVLVDQVQEAPVDQIGVENEAASTSLVDHLLARGHTRVAYVGGAAELPTSIERLAGYETALTRRDLTVDRDLIAQDCGSQDAARRAMAQMLTLAEPPTAVFTATYAATLGVLRAARVARLQVPGDLAVVSFDEVPWSGVAEPAMTVLAQPWFAIGARAVQLLVRRMQDRQIPLQSLRLAGEIVHRRSCGCDAAPLRDAEGVLGLS